MKIFLDLDGVILDTPSAILKETKISGPWPAGNYDQLGPICIKDWLALANKDFWLRIPMYPEARTIIDICNQFGETIFLTGVCSGNNLVGRYQWYQSMKEFSYIPLIQTNDKEVFGGMNSNDYCIIDDCPAIKEMYQENCFLYPRIQNERYEQRKEGTKLLKTWLRRAINA